MMPFVNTAVYYFSFPPPSPAHPREKSSTTFARIGARNPSPRTCIQPEIVPRSRPRFSPLPSAAVSVNNTPRVEQTPISKWLLDYVTRESPLVRVRLGNSAWPVTSHRRVDVSRIIPRGFSICVDRLFYRELIPWNFSRAIDSLTRCLSDVERQWN